MKSVKVGARYFGGVFLAIVGIPLAFQELMYGGHLLLKIRPLQASTRAYLEAFLDDQKLLADETFFDIKSGEVNAAPYLNYRLDWAPPTPSLVRHLSVNPPKILLPKKLASQIRAWGPDFPRYHAKLHYDEFDVSWLGELAQYDYWDIVELSSADEVFENKKAMSLYFTQTLAPDFEQLVLAAKARLMKGMHEGELLEAVTETHHFARLLYTTETLMGAMAAIAILRAERTMYDYLQTGIQTGIAGWEPPERGLLDRARRAILASNALMTVFTPSDVLHKVFFEPNVKIGLCSALAKGILRGLLTRPLLEPAFPLERDFKEAYRDFDDILEANQDRCRLKHLKAMWSNRRTRLVWLGLVGENSWDWLNLHASQHLPFIRKAWGIDLASVFLSNGLDSYERPLN